jgi:uncharacterized protein involved in exopolysaccharide biosynthesis
MISASQPNLMLRDSTPVLLAYPKRWLIPAAAITALAILYAAFGPATWEASQALIVRNEANNGQEGPGRFDHPDEMKTVQETIVELVKSRGVLVTALAKVGPAADRKRSAAWPDPQAVADLRDSVRLSPPKGTEFGRSEIFYLVVRDHDRGRAAALDDAICGQLQARFQDLRDAKARSMIDELGKTVALARTDVGEVTACLTEMEKKAGSNLAELRFLQENGSSDSSLRRMLTEINAELRQTQTAQQTDQELLALLTAAKADSRKLLATPNKLLDSQPSLRRLKEGLLDAQIRSAQFQGRMLDSHPLLQASKEAEEKIAQRLHVELDAAIGGLEVDIRLGAAHLHLLQTQLAKVTDALEQIAAVRAPYANLVAEAKNRAALLARAEQNLAEARNSQASAKASSLISLIDTPDTGVNPIGPGRTLIVLVGIIGGLLVGLGIVALTVQLEFTSRATPLAVDGPSRSSLPAQNGVSLGKALQKASNGKHA